MIILLKKQLKDTESQLRNTINNALGATEAESQPRKNNNASQATVAEDHSHGGVGSIAAVEGSEQ